MVQAAMPNPPALSAPVEVEFRAKLDGTMQRYVICLPEGFMGKGRKYTLMIALHGHGSDRRQFATDPRGECAGARDMAAKYGMIFVSPDYRATTSWMGPKAEADLVQIIRDLGRKYPIDKTMVMGGSMGGSSALTFTALHPELVDGVVSLNGTANHLEYNNFQEAIAESFGGTKAQIPLEYKKRSAEYWPERFTMPVAITAGAKDDTVPSGSVVRLANVLKQMGRAPLLILREDGGHSTSYEDTVAALEYVVERLGIRPGH